MKQLILEILYYSHNFLWLLVPIIFYLRKSKFSLYFLPIGLAANLIVILGFFDIKIHNTLHFTALSVQIFAITKLFFPQHLSKLAFLPLIFSIHIFNYFVYKNYDFEPYIYLAYDLILVFILRKHMIKAEHFSPIILVMFLAVIYEMIGEVSLIFQAYDFFYIIAYSGDIFALYYIFSDEKKTIKNPLVFRR